MYWSQGSIAALPAAINSLGLLDAQTVYWSVLTMTKSHPSQRAKEPRRRERAKQHLLHSIIIIEMGAALKKGARKKVRTAVLRQGF